MMHVRRSKLFILWIACCLTSLGAVAEPDDDESFLGALATIQEKNREFDAAQESYQQLISLIEERDGIYAVELIEPLTGSGRVNLEQSNYEQAEAQFKRAQHLSHRAEGVHTPRQKEIIDLLTRIHMELDQPLAGDQQQRFSLYLSERQSGKNSTKLLPALYKMAEWYLETGQFSRSRKIYEKAEDIIVEHDGDQDLKLVEALRGIARTRQLQGVCCSYKPLQRLLTILKAAEQTKPAEIALAMAELADGYSISKKRSQARKFYRQAWLTLQSEPEKEKRENLFHQPEQIAMSKKLGGSQSRRKIYMVRQNRSLTGNFMRLTGDETRVDKYLPPQIFTIAPYEKHYHQHIRDQPTRFDADQQTRQVIGVPVQFLYDQLKHILPSALHDPEKLAELFIELKFTVREDGSVTDIVITATNAPTKLIRTMKQAMSKSRFRPRVQQGEPIETKDVQLTQVFK